MSKEKWIGHICMLVTAVIFGLNISITKSLMPDWMDSIGITFMRMSFAAVAFWITSLFVRQEKVASKDMVLIFIGGIFGTVLNQMSFVTGLGFTNSIDAAIVITITPIIVMILAAIFLKEPLSMMKIGGVLLGASGALLVIMQSDTVTATAPNVLLGNLLCLLSSLSYAIYLVISRSVVQRYHPITLMKWMFLFATLVSLPFSYTHVVSAKLFTSAATVSVWLRLGYVTALATFVTYLLIGVALKRIRPTTVSMYNYLQPLVASIAAYFLLQGNLSWSKVFAALLIFTGVWLVTNSKAKGQEVK